MGKIALISPYPIPTRIAGARERHVSEVIKLFKELGMDTEIFSLSDRDAKSRVFGSRQNEVKLAHPEEKGFGAGRLFDFFVLTLFGFKPSLEKMSRSDKLIDEIARYNPDVIYVIDIMFSKSIHRYKEKYSDSKVKVVAHSDSFSIEADMELLNSMGNLKGRSLLFKTIRNAIEPNYHKYQLSLYKLLLEISDVFLTMGDVPKKRILKDFPSSKGKVYGIFPMYVDIKNLKKARYINKVRRILFMGTCGQGDNQTSIDNIQQRIAPNLPEKEFIISGRGCPDCSINNVRFTPAKGSVAERISSSDICIAPLTGLNTGVKTKIFDYFAANKIVIGTNAAFIGFHVVNNKNALIENDISKYPSRIEELDKNPALIKSIQSNMHTALKGYDKNDALRKWIKVFKKLDVY